MALSKLVLSLNLGGPRRLQVHENNKVFIKDLVTKMCAFFTSPHWKRFVGVIADIEEHVQLSSVGKITHYTQHIGDMWHVSVNSKFPTVDIRRWYEDSRAGTSLKLTCVGIALLLLLLLFLPFLLFIIIIIIIIIIIKHIYRAHFRGMPQMR